VNLQVAKDLRQDDSTIAKRRISKEYPAQHNKMERNEYAYPMAIITRIAYLGFIPTKNRYEEFMHSKSSAMQSAPDNEIPVGAMP